jgi:hypothetical protein
MKRVLLLACLAPIPALAQNYPVATGPGLSTCQQYEHLHREDPSMVDAFFVWAEGYLSGLNDRYVTEGGPANLLPPNFSTDGQKAYLDRFCRQYPDAPYMQGVVELFHDMRRGQKLPIAEPAAPPAPGPRRR